MGFSINIHAFALPLIGAGMILRLINKEGRYASFGLAMVGFGLFFIGIDILKEAFEGLVALFDITKIKAEGATQIIIFLMIGIGMTILTQSSSASIALTITAAATGVVGIEAAAAMVIGANIGTTSTAVFAAIGATDNAKRVACAQVIFNIGTGVIALIILPVMVFSIEFLSRALHLTPDPSISLALFHSVFNILGVILIFPLNNRLVIFLNERFIAQQEHDLPLRYLDKTTISTPVLAVNALVMELKSIAQRVSFLGRTAINANHIKTDLIYRELMTIRKLSMAASKFIATLERGALTEETINQISTLLRIDQYLLSNADLAEQIYLRRLRVNDLNIGDSIHDIDSFQRSVSEMLAHHFSVDVNQLFEAIQHQHDEVKVRLLKSGAHGHFTFEIILEYIDQIGDELKLAQQWVKALNNLQHLDQEIGSPNHFVTEHMRDFNSEQENDQAIKGAD